MGSDLGEFLQQPFVSGILGLLCLFALLLVIVVAALVYVRRRKAQQTLTPADSPAAANDDMPDLDALVNTAEFTPAAPPASVPVPVQRPARKGAFMVTVQDGEAAEAVEVLTVLRDVVDGRLMVQMGDKTYQNVNSDADFKERFNRVMRELAQVAAKPAQPQAEPPQQEEAAPAKPPAVPAEAEAQAATPIQSDDEAETPALADLIQPPPAPKPGKAQERLPGDLPSFKLDDNPLEPRKRGRKQDVKPVPEVNIAAAIEAYLQHKLRLTPQYAGRSIHIYPAPDGGVSIEVDGHFYEAVGDIAETDVREFIAGAIQEWQDRH